jgi:hypothetical protein
VADRRCVGGEAMKRLAHLMTLRRESLQNERDSATHAVELPAVSSAARPAQNVAGLVELGHETRQRI